MLRILSTIAIVSAMLAVLIGVPALLGYMFGGGRATTAWATAIASVGIAYLGFRDIYRLMRPAQPELPRATARWVLSGVSSREVLP